MVTGKDRRVVRGWKKPAPRALPQSSQQAWPRWPLLPLSIEPAGPWESGVWNQTVQGVSLGSAASWLVTGLGQVLKPSETSVPSSVRSRSTSHSRGSGLIKASAGHLARAQSVLTLQLGGLAPAAPEITGPVSTTSMRPLGPLDLGHFFPSHTH